MIRVLSWQLFSAYRRRTPVVQKGYSAARKLYSTLPLSSTPCPLFRLTEQSHAIGVPEGWVSRGSLAAQGGKLRTGSFAVNSGAACQHSTHAHENGPPERTCIPMQPLEGFNPAYSSPAGSPRRWLRVNLHPRRGDNRCMPAALTLLCQQKQFRGELLRTAFKEHGMAAQGIVAEEALWCMP